MARGEVTLFLEELIVEIKEFKKELVEEIEEEILNQYSY